jgi:hypothetical protein
MVLLSVDPHKDTDTHTVVAVDQAGRQLDQRTVPARMLGHGELVGWARMHWRPIGSGRWRAAGMSPAGWNATCWPLGSWWCGCRRG